MAIFKNWNLAISSLFSKYKSFDFFDFLPKILIFYQKIGCHKIKISKIKTDHRENQK